MENQLDKLIEQSARILQLVELLVESGALKKKAPRQRVSNLPVEQVDALREAEIERIFNRMANASGALKVKLNFSKAIRQDIGQPVKQIVPLSILLNRCELLKAFWPVAGSTEIGTPRDVVERYVDRFVKRKVWVRGKVSQYFPKTANTRAGDTIIVLTKAEVKRIVEGVPVDDEETEPEAEEAPAPVKKLRPWDDPNYVPGAEDDDEEDEDWDDEDAEPAPEAPRFTKTPPGKPRFSDEGIETGLAPTPTKPVKKVPATITDQETGEETPAPKKLWSIGGEDDGDE